MQLRRWRPALAGTASLAALSALACASGPGLSPHRVYSLERPPYYAGQSAAPGGLARVGHLPVGVDIGEHRDFEYGEIPGTLLDSLLARMTERLDSLEATVRLPDSNLPLPGAPDVYFGCERDVFGDACVEGDEEPRFLQLQVARPSTAWVAEVQSRAAAGALDYVISIALEFSEYFPRQRDLLGRKEMRLGTGYSVSLPWVTATDRSVHVLQLTGVLTSRDGTILRAGAEGMLAKRTPFLLSAIGVQQLFRQEDLRELMTGARREDLAGQPLVWEVALQNLVAQLLERPELLWQ